MSGNGEVRARMLCIRGATVLQAGRCVAGIDDDRSQIDNALIVDRRMICDNDHGIGGRELRVGDGAAQRGSSARA